MLKYPHYEPAVKRLEKLSKEADELLTGLTAENIEERYRERANVMVKVNNLKWQLSEKTTVCDEVQYHVSPVVPLKF
ncbi:MAG: hypothetical protein Q8M66_07355 [Actinomycetota bacterium]|nr:hypothetical protein [Actinomycetota bacterium]